MGPLVASVTADRTAEEVRGIGVGLHEVAARLRAIAPQALVWIVNGAARVSLFTQLCT